MSSQDQKEKLEAQLDALKIFPNTVLVRNLRRQIKAELEKIERKEKVLVPRPEDIKTKANLSRSSKAKKYHRYIRLIRNNFPELSYGDIRKQFSKRRRGIEVSISDAVWQNPSP